MPADNPTTNSPKLLHLSVAIVSAYVRKNSVPMAEVPAVLSSVHETLEALSSADGAGQAERQASAIFIKKSITPDYLICFEDGKKLKTLKRYLNSRFQLSPDQYRTRWGLPSDYPMVAPNYSARRSALAKKSGLGRGGASARKRKATK